MSSHAAFRADRDLLARAADGDGSSALALLARHGQDLQKHALADGDDPAYAVAAVAGAFAALLTGTARPTADDELGWLRALVARQPVSPTSLRQPPGHAVASHDALVAALAARLPEDARDALLAAHRDAATGATIATAAPEEAPPIPPQGGLGQADFALAALVELQRTVPPDDLATATEVAARPTPAGRARSLDRYVERPSPLRWLAPLALVATIVAIWSWSQLPGRLTFDAFFPEPPPIPSAVPVAPTANRPTLPPRTTRVAALPEATATTVAAPIAAPSEVPTATPRPVATATGTRAVAVIPTVASAPPAPPLATTVPAAPTATATRPPAVPTVAPPPLAPTTTPRPPAPSPTAVASAAPTAPSPSPTATRVPTDPAALVLATQSLAFGVEIGPRAFTFTNPGGAPLTWRIVADSTWIELSTVSGAVPPGGTQAVGITIARGDLPTGAYSGVLQIISDGGEGLVPVTMTVSPSNTTISAFAEPTTPIGALGCADPTTHTVSAAIGGDRSPQKATLYFALNGGTQQTKDLTAVGNGRYSAVLGPFTETGDLVYSLVVTEADGTVVRSAPYTLHITGCPTQVQTVPVVPPVTQPFALQSGGHTIYTFAVTRPGTLQVILRWQGGSQRLSTLLYGPRRADQPYEQRTGVGGLTWTFPVTEEDVAAGGTWALHLVNYGTGAANGTFDLTFTPLGQPLPTPGPSASPSLPPSSAPPATPAPSSAPSAPPSAAPSAAPAPSPTPKPAPSAPPPPPAPTTAPPRPAVPGTPTTPGSR